MRHEILKKFVFRKSDFIEINFKNIFIKLIIILSDLLLRISILLERMLIFIVSASALDVDVLN